MEHLLTILSQIMQPRYDGGGGAIAGALILWFLVIVGGIVAWIIFLIAVWRMMKAHESIAHSVYLAAKAHESMAGSAYQNAPLPPQPAPPVRGPGNL